MSITPLPAGARILHIGPFKTGSTALQHALHNARDALADQGVSYVSRSRHDAFPARYAVDALLPDQLPEKGRRAWRRVVRKLRSAEETRALYSSEYLCLADDAQIDRIVGDVGRGPTWVVVTLRPLAALLPSQYQQLLQGDLRLPPYRTWARAVLEAAPGEGPTRSFWRRHRHDALVERWGRAAGLDRVVVLVLGRDHDWTARAFEQLLGLSSGTLSFDGVPSNRSLTWPEAEVLRSFNQQYADARLPKGAYRPLVGHAVQHLKLRAPGADEEPIATERWAVERANAIGAEMAEGLRRSGVRVHGDLAQLGAVPVPDHEPPQPTHVRTDVAARFAVGLARAAEQYAEERRADQDLP